MPCYTEPPSVTREQWLFDMYVKALGLLTEEQRDQLLSDDYFREGFKKLDLEALLCRICKLLDRDQLCSIHGRDIYQGLFRWYTEHLLLDYIHNSYVSNILEAKRLGCILKNEDGCATLDYNPD